MNTHPLAVSEVMDDETVSFVESIFASEVMSMTNIDGTRMPYSENPTLATYYSDIDLVTAYKPVSSLNISSSNASIETSLIERMDDMPTVLYQSKSTLSHISSAYSKNLNSNSLSTKIETSADGAFIRSSTTDVVTNSIPFPGRDTPVSAESNSQSFSQISSDDDPRRINPTPSLNSKVPDTTYYTTVVLNKPNTLNSQADHSVSTYLQENVQDASFPWNSTNSRFIGDISQTRSFNTTKPSINSNENHEYSKTSSVEPTRFSAYRYIPDNISSLTENILSETVVSSESVSIYSSFQRFISKDRVTLSDTKTLDFSTGVAELMSASISTISKLQIDDSAVIQTIYFISDSVTVDTDLDSFPIFHTPEYISSFNEGEDIRKTPTVSALPTNLPNDTLRGLSTGSVTTLRSRVSSTNSFEYKNSMTAFDSQLLPIVTFRATDDRGISPTSDFISKISRVFFIKLDEGSIRYSFIDN